MLSSLSNSTTSVFRDLVYVLVSLQNIPHSGKHTTGNGPEPSRQRHLKVRIYTRHLDLLNRQPDICRCFVNHWQWISRPQVYQLMSEGTPFSRGNLRFSFSTSYQKGLQVTSMTWPSGS